MIQSVLGEISMRRPLSASDVTFFSQRLRRFMTPDGKVSAENLSFFWTYCETAVAMIKDAAEVYAPATLSTDVTDAHGAPIQLVRGFAFSSADCEREFADYRAPEATFILRFSQSQIGNFAVR